MNSNGRRQFLKVLSISAVGTMVGRSLIARAAAEPWTSDELLPGLRSRLLEQRERVRSLRLRCTVETSGAIGTPVTASWPSAGRSHLYLSHGRQRIEHVRNDCQVLEINDQRRYLHEIVHSNGAHQLLYRGPLAANRRPAASLQIFLPVLRDVPAYDLGVTTVDGQQVQLVGQGNDTFQVAMEGPSVLQIDVFSTATRPKEQIRYSRFVSTAAGVDFPTHVRITRFDAGGDPSQVVEVTVDDLDANPTLGDDLFAIEGISRHSWTARGADEALPPIA
jgi:hypothetical protein